VVLRWAMWYSGEPCGTQVSHVVLRWAMWYSGELCGTQVSHVVLRWAMWYSGEPCGTQVSYVVLRWAMWYSGEPCGTQMSHVVLGWAMWYISLLVFMSYSCDFTSNILYLIWTLIFGVWDSKERNIQWKKGWIFSFILLSFMGWSYACLQYLLLKVLSAAQGLFDWSGCTSLDLLWRIKINFKQFYLILSLIGISFCT
jgi:hypothetical protein